MYAACLTPGPEIVPVGFRLSLSSSRPGKNVADIVCGLSEIISGRIFRRQLTAPIEKDFDSVVTQFEENVRMVERVAYIKECRRRIDEETREAQERSGTQPAPRFVSKG
jgi:hypothetical protein